MLGTELRWLGPDESVAAAARLEGALLPALEVALDEVVESIPGKQCSVSEDHGPSLPIKMFSGMDPPKRDRGLG